MRRALGLALLAVVASACYRPVELPGYLREPEIVGRIASLDPAPEPTADARTYLLTLETGEAVEVDLNSVRRLEGSAPPFEDAILLYGHDPDGEPWLWIGDDCSLPSRALDGGDSIDFEIGLRLPKADDFDPGWITDGEFSNEINSLCINEDGEVTDLRG